MTLDPGWKNLDPGSGRNILDPQHRFFAYKADPNNGLTFHLPSCGIVYFCFIPGLFNVHDAADPRPAGVQGGQVQHRVQRPLLRGEDAGEFHYTVGDDLCYVPTFLICSTLQASMLFLKMCSEMCS